jgi:hypothetical protein
MQAGVVVVKYVVAAVQVKDVGGVGYTAYGKNTSILSI